MPPPPILCAQDDRDLFRVHQQALLGQGYEVVAAHDGEQALARCDQTCPDLVLLDVLLSRRDGFDVLEELRRRPEPLGSVPVVLLSSCRISDRYRKRAIETGAATIMAKPVALDSLLEQVAELVRTPIPAPAQRSPAPGRRPPKRARGPAKTTRGSSKHPRNDAGDLPASGSLREVDFACLLHQLHGARASGVLLLRDGKKKKALQLRDGHPVAVRSNLVSECLGDRLVRQGALDEALLRESLRRVKRGEGLQGQILVAMEVMDEEELAAALREQAREKLFEIFRWRRGQFELKLGARLKRANAVALDGSPADVVVEGARGFVPLSRVDHFFAQHSAGFVVRGENAFFRFQSIELGANEERLVAQLDGGQRLAEFAGQPEAVRRTLYALIVTEFLELRERAGHSESEDAERVESARTGARQPNGPRPGARQPNGRRSRTGARQPLSSATAATSERVASFEAEAPATGGPSSRAEEEATLRAELAEVAERMRGQTCYELLGLPTTADDREVQEAHEKLARRFHPDRFQNSSGAVSRLAEEVYAAVDRAYETLVSAAARASYARSLSRGARQSKERDRGRRALAAEQAFQQGEAALRRRDYEGALLLFGRALEKFPEEGEYHAHYGWSLHLCHPGNAVIIQEAIEHARHGVKLARDREKPYLYLGRLYKVVGKIAVAEKMFTRAVQIRPDCVEAMRELRLIHMRQEKNKGILGRLLRR